MTRILCESATISDVLKRAAKFSPKPGDTESPGIYIHVTDEMLVIRSTNLELFIIIWSSYIEKTGPAVDWIFPAYTSKYCEQLSHTTGKTIEFNDEDKPGFITIKQNRSKGTLPLITNVDYPTWATFTEDDSSVVTNFGSRLDQVRWATASSGSNVPPPLQGVYIDGSHVLASDSFVAARVPVDIPSITEPITIHAATIADAIRHDGDVRITRLKNGLGISPDNYTQIFCRAYGENTCAKLKLVTEFDKHVQINSENISSVIKKMLELAKGKDELYIRLAVANEQINLSLTTTDSESEDVVDIPGFAQWEDEDIFHFDPNILFSCLNKTPTNTVTLSYSDGKKSVYISSGTYQAWIARKEIPNGSKAQG